VAVESLLVIAVEVVQAPSNALLSWTA
jgi:hypothetical protein